MATLWIVSASYDTSKSAKNQPARMRPRVAAIDSEDEDEWSFGLPRHPTPMRQIGDNINNVVHYVGVYETEAEARVAARNF